MESCKKSALKHIKTLQNHCCTGFSGYFTRHVCQLNAGLAARSWKQLGHLSNVRSVSQNRQTGQQKSCIEIAAIDASVDGRSIPSDTHRIQGFGQLPVAPCSLPHPSLNQQFCLEAPFLQDLGLGLCFVRLLSQIDRAPHAIHICPPLCIDGLRNQLKSILSHNPPVFPTFQFTFMEIGNA